MKVHPKNSLLAVVSHTKRGRHGAGSDAASGSGGTTPAPFSSHPAQILQKRHSCFGKAAPGSFPRGSLSQLGDFQDESRNPGCQLLTPHVSGRERERPSSGISSVNPGTIQHKYFERGGGRGMESSFLGGKMLLPFTRWEVRRHFPAWSDLG